MGEKSVAFAEQIARESAAELRGPPPRDPFAPTLSTLVGGGGGAPAAASKHEVTLHELKGLSSAKGGGSGGGSQLSASGRASQLSAAVTSLRWRHGLTPGSRHSQRVSKRLQQRSLAYHVALHVKDLGAARSVLWGRLAASLWAR